MKNVKNVVKQPATVGDKTTERLPHLFSDKDLQRLLIPLIIEQLLISFMGTVDTVMVSNVGPAAMSAVSCVDTINILFIQAFSALAAGGCIVCSQYMGKGNLKAANEAARQVLLVILTISVAIAGLCLLFHKPLLKVTFGSVEADVMDASIIYFVITLISFPFLGIYNGGAAIFRSQGNSKLPMIISVSSNLLNVAGNAIFIWVIPMGVAGVALSTMLSRVVSAVAVMIFLHNPKLQISVHHYFKIRPNRDLIRKIMQIGIPAGVENSMFQFGKLAIQSSVSTLGTIAIAAQGMTNILEGLNGVAASGVGVGLMTIVGQCMGAGRKDEAVYYIKKCWIIAEACIVGSCLFVFAIVKPVTIVANMDPESARLCIWMVGWITLVKPVFWVLSFVTVNGLRAAGDVKFAMIVSTCTMWFCRVALATVLIRVFHFGPIAVWIGMFADWAVRALIFTLRFHSRKWLNHKVVG